MYVPEVSRQVRELNGRLVEREREIPFSANINFAVAYLGTFTENTK